MPTADDLFGWIKDAFRNSFNNFNPTSALFAKFRERGLVATENLAAYIHALLEVYKGRLQRGDAVPDTMLTRLLRLQLQVSDREGRRSRRNAHRCSVAPFPRESWPGGSRTR